MHAERARAETGGPVEDHMRIRAYAYTGNGSRSGPRMDRGFLPETQQHRAGRGIGGSQRQRQRQATAACLPALHTWLWLAGRRPRLQTDRPVQ